MGSSDVQLYLGRLFSNMVVDLITLAVSSEVYQTTSEIGLETFARKSIYLAGDSAVCVTQLLSMLIKAGGASQGLVLPPLRTNTHLRTCC